MTDRKRRCRSTNEFVAKQNMIPADYSRAGCHPPADKDGFYLVEEILGRRKAKNGTYQYKIRWLGYDSRWDSWEPEELLNDYNKTYVRNRYILKTNKPPTRTKEQYEILTEHFQATKESAFTQGKAEELMAFDFQMDTKDYDYEYNIDQEWKPGSDNRRKGETKKLGRKVFQKNKEQSVEFLTKELNNILQGIGCTDTADDLDVLIAQCDEVNEQIDTDANKNVVETDVTMETNFIEKYAAAKRLRLVQSNEDSDSDSDSSVNSSRSTHRDSITCMKQSEFQSGATAATAPAIQVYQNGHQFGHEKDPFSVSFSDNENVHSGSTKTKKITSKYVPFSILPQFIPCSPSEHDDLTTTTKPPLFGSTIFSSKLYALICEEEDDDSIYSTGSLVAINPSITKCFTPVVGLSKSASTISDCSSLCITAAGNGRSVSGDYSPKVSAVPVTPSSHKKRRKKRRFNVPIPSFSSF